MVSELSKNTHGWDAVGSEQRIRQIAQEYAKRYRLPLTSRRGY
jgi:hypothetical protein